jgi:hypothetical protein
LDAAAFKSELKFALKTGCLLIIEKASKIPSLSGPKIRELTSFSVFFWENSKSGNYNDSLKINT